MVVQTEPRMDALVGTVLEGAYRITRLIGEGGMGAVYEAVQLRLAKRVAVKLMARHLAADEKAWRASIARPKSPRTLGTRIWSRWWTTAKRNRASPIW